MKFKLKDWLIANLIIIGIFQSLWCFGIDGDKMNSVVISLRWLMVMLSLCLSFGLMLMIEVTCRAREKAQTKALKKSGEDSPIYQQELSNGRIVVYGTKGKEIVSMYGANGTVRVRLTAKTFIDEAMKISAALQPKHESKFTNNK